MDIHHESKPKMSTVKIFGITISSVAALAILAFIVAVLITEPFCGPIFAWQRQTGLYFPCVLNT